jgi:hypothetical protein
MNRHHYRCWGRNSWVREDGFYRKGEGIKKEKASPYPIIMSKRLAAEQRELQYTSP